MEEKQGENCGVCDVGNKDHPVAPGRDHACKRDRTQQNQDKRIRDQATEHRQACYTDAGVLSRSPAIVIQNDLV
jgi:hypothetical protein